MYVYIWNVSFVSLIDVAHPFTWYFSRFRLSARNTSTGTHSADMILIFSNATSSTNHHFCGNITYIASLVITIHDNDGL